VRPHRSRRRSPLIREGIGTRLAESLEQALKLAEGLAYLDPVDPPERKKWFERS
jgi:excinuclease ABC subunit A